MREQWLVAAERYAQFSKEFGLRTDQVRAWAETCAQIRTFVVSEEGFAASALLAASGKFIILANLERDLENSVFVSGLARTRRNVFPFSRPMSLQDSRICYGWHSYGPAKFALNPAGLGVSVPPRPIPVGEMAKVFLLKYQTSSEAFDYLRGELNKISAEAPKPPEE